MTRVTLLLLPLAAVLPYVGCISLDYVPPRTFPDMPALERQFRPSENLYRSLAVDWLQTGGTSFCWFGTSMLGLETYQWGEYWVSAKWLSWDVMHSGRDDYIHESAATFDQTAIMSGTKPDQILRWHNRIASLRVDCISTVTGTFDDNTFRYVELRCFPARHPNGLLYARPDNEATARAFEMWERQTPPPGRLIKSFGNGWFYYDGFYTNSDIPFKIQR